MKGLHKDIGPGTSRADAEQIKRDSAIVGFVDEAGKHLAALRVELDRRGYPRPPACDRRCSVTITTYSLELAAGRLDLIVSETEDAIQIVLRGAKPFGFEEQRRRRLMFELVEMYRNDPRPFVTPEAQR